VSSVIASPVTSEGLVFTLNCIILIDASSCASLSGWINSLQHSLLQQQCASACLSFVVLHLNGHGLRSVRLCPQFEKRRVRFLHILPKYEQGQCNEL
ncbi:MAG TPA: hypothetical protein VHV10_04670, partial [Ktedonobacteraceae bacterium]|nr:hypothetical protein [Ktedonobacteraceae bacterium]